MQNIAFHICCFCKITQSKFCFYVNYRIKSTLCYQRLENAGVRYGYADFDDERLAGIGSDQLNDVLETLYKLNGDFESRVRMTHEKVYAVDVAMMDKRENAFAGKNLGWRLENIVFVQLLRECKANGWGMIGPANRCPEFYLTQVHLLFLLTKHWQQFLS